MIHRVITSEKVPITYRVAGLGSRLLAWLMDLGLIAVGVAALVGISGPLDTWRFGFGTAVALVGMLTLQWGYFVLFEWLWHGQTPGKVALGLQVIQLNGTGVTFVQAATRNVLRVVDGLPLLAPQLPPVAYGVGFLAACSNPAQRRLGDLAAGTLVIFVERRTGPLRVVHASETEEQRLRAARARQRVEQLSRDQKQAIVDLCLRRDQLRLRERARLFAHLAEYFRRRLDVAPAQYESDEKFILEMASLLTAESKPLSPLSPGAWAKG